MRVTITETARARGWAGWGRLVVALTFVVTLLGLGAANVALRASWNEVEDGVLWTAGPQGVTAAEVAERTPAFEPASGKETCCSPSTARPSRRRPTCCTRSIRGTPAPA